MIFIPLSLSYLLFWFAFNQNINFSRFAKFGDPSYGIYIYGFLIQQVVIMCFNGQMSSQLNTIIALPIACLFGYASYHLIEKHFLKLKTYIIKWV